MTIALFVARLQPLHKGHLHAIKKILEKFDRVLIAIGSSQAKRERNNPLSYEERKELIVEVLKNEDILDRCIVVGVPDAHNDRKWAETIKKYSFDVAVTGNDWTERCLRSDFEVVKPDFLEPDKYNSTRIRNIMRAGGDWKDLVPKTVFDFVKQKLSSGEVDLGKEVEKTQEW